jgi:hypothetical protein
MQMMKDFQKFKADMQAKNPGMNPQEFVNQMVSSGKVSQAQFEQARNKAMNLANSLGFKF